ncbi:DUF6011 domain-containing protein [Amycolatopsis cynarae]|uniref:DUF6011 domain-containing protein n=1 Tax=Amycolatopsis cynarae TaxID=2995223 RepID=A0ABY7B4I0_9PSEU|nr:DUF6011 domain-containing protein [Amycolatopsis sp. HUAS 11-8]WAL67215.1 DUF6011 domain-containing protein [Amycolatopsis sp. HUAS 11-8]
MTVLSIHPRLVTGPDLDVRCERCRRPLSARVSVALGLGPACRRHIETTEPTRRAS